MATRSGPLVDHRDRIHRDTVYVGSGALIKSDHGAALRVAVRQFAGNPFLVFGSRPVRERRTRAHIVAEHRAGRSIALIMCDSYMQRYAGESLAWRVLVNPETIRALGDDACDAIRSVIASSREGGSSFSDSMR